MDELIVKIQSHLIDSNAQITVDKTDNGKFEIKGKGIKGSVYTNVIVCPHSETLTEDKLNKCKCKVIQADILMPDNQMLKKVISQEDVSFTGFKRLLFNIPEYGCISDAECSAIYKLFTRIASCGLPSETVYDVPGLTLDNKLFIFNGVPLEAQSKPVLTEQEKADSLEAFNMLIGCCIEDKSLLLLELLMISTVFEVIKQMSVTDRRNCLPTFVPYLYGESGVGKTTIIKAFFAEMDECNRFVSLANATTSGILKQISSICSGMVVVDDVPHTSANKCSRNAMESLEAVIRTYGDDELKSAVVELNDLYEKGGSQEVVRGYAYLLTVAQFRLARLLYPKDTIDRCILSDAYYSCFEQDYDNDICYDNNDGNGYDDYDLDAGLYSINSFSSSNSHRISNVPERITHCDCIEIARIFDPHLYYINADLLKEIHKAVRDVSDRNRYENEVAPVVEKNCLFVITPAN